MWSLLCARPDAGLIADGFPSSKACGEGVRAEGVSVDARGRRPARADDDVALEFYRRSSVAAPNSADRAETLAAGAGVQLFRALHASPDTSTFQAWVEYRRYGMGRASVGTSD